MDPKLTGKIIFEKRKEKGLNQLQLGQLLNVSNRTISKWEKGDGYPDITLLPEISQCLGISIDELLTGEKIKAEPVPDNNDDEKEDETISISKLLNDFKLCFIVSLFLSICSASLGGITELYCIWAFPILFYTHWEIMFAAVSLFAVIASVLSVYSDCIHNTQSKKSSTLPKTRHLYFLYCLPYSLSPLWQG